MERHTREQRRRNMQAVKNKDSEIELSLRRAFYHQGYRYRKNCRAVFGCPDIVFTREKIAVFCDSEFWHGYDWEHRKADFKSHQEFWIPKIERNMERDREVNAELDSEGYLVLRFWGEKIKHELNSVVQDIEEAIRVRRQEIGGHGCR